jgi:hypothetical protein
MRSERYQHQSRNQLARKVHFYLGLFHSTGLITNILGHSLTASLASLPLVALEFGLDGMFHDIARSKSKRLITALKQDGYHHSENLNQGINEYLKKRGGLFFSNLYLFRKSLIPHHSQSVSLPPLKKSFMYRLSHDFLNRKFLNHISK